MKNGDKIVRKERGGKVGPIGGQKADEYTEKYEIVAKAIKSAEEILSEDRPRNAERIANIQTGKIVINDTSPSNYINIVNRRLDEALAVERNREGCISGKKNKYDKCID